MKRKSLSVLLTFAMVLSLFVPLIGIGIAVAEESESEADPQFSLVFAKGDGSLITADGTKIELSEATRIGDIGDKETAKLGFHMWHHDDGYWQWTQGDETMRIEIDMEEDPNYLKFNELMADRGARVSFNVTLPEDVQEKAAAGRRIVAVISAGYALDMPELDENRLDISHLIPFGLDESRYTIEVADDSGEVTVSLPIMFNFRRRTISNDAQRQLWTEPEAITG